MDAKSYFSFEGRIPRARFIRFYGLPYLVVGALPGLLLPHGPIQVTLETLVLALVVAGIARRLHDVDRSLWVFTFVWGLNPAVLAVQTTGVFGHRRSLAILLSSIPFLVMILWLFVVRGTRGPNRFGEDPTNRGREH